MLRALIADDEFHVRRSVQNCLRELQPHITVVAEASDGEQMIELARQYRPDVLFVDVMMPKLNGLEAAQQLRQQLPGASFIFLTAYDRFEFVQSALRLGAADFLLKPVRKQDVQAAISRLHPGGTEPPPDSQAEMIMTARKFIGTNFNEPLTLSEVAEHVHVSSCHFSRLFKKVTGQTFSRYLLNRRLEAAKHLLISTNLPCKAVADETGFCSSGHFSTVFRREVGMPPSEFRSSKRLC